MLVLFYFSVGVEINLMNLFLQMTKGDFHVINLNGGGGSTIENIFPSDKVRHKNNNPSVTSQSFHKFTLDVPDDVRNW